VNLAIWPRTMPAALTALLDGLPGDQLPRARFSVRPRAAGPAIRDHIAAALPQPSLGRKLLIDDIAALVQHFAEATGAWAVTVRLDPIDNDACRKFHADHVGIRLLTTYRGPGTQWLPNEAVAGTPLADGVGAEIEPAAAAIRDLPRYAVGLFKGAAWPGNAGNGIVHRSPPILGTGVTRFLFCLDAAE
jgi:hypothetical protein